MGTTYGDAARVCLSRHHDPPIDVTIHNDDSQSVRTVSWDKPDVAVGRAWNNADDATTAGAYAVALAAVEAELGLLAVARADTRTGADYYLNTGALRDLEAAYRLEVSGVDHGTLGDINRRLREKVDQARRGKSNLPAIAAVVGFLARRIAIRRVR